VLTVDNRTTNTVRVTLYDTGKISIAVGGTTSSAYGS